MLDRIVLPGAGGSGLLRGKAAALMCRISRSLLVLVAAFVSPAAPHAAQMACGQNVVAMASPTVCPRCGKVHGQPSRVATPVVRSSVPGSPASASTGRVVSPAAPRGSVATVSARQPLRTLARSAANVLDLLNRQRSRQGLGILRYDPQLQAVAERRAQLMAARGMKGHPPGSFSPGRYEGVGWSSSYSPSGVSACFTSDPRMRVAGAAMATGSDGVYFCVVYR